MDDIQVLGPEHAECVAGYRLLREELAKRTTELDEARAEIVRLGQELEQSPSAMFLSGPIGPCPTCRTDPCIHDDPPSPVPRVWKKGDPEPPEDVVLLRNIGEMSVGLPYLRRGDGGWRWVGSPTERVRRTVLAVASNQGWRCAH